MSSIPGLPSQGSDITILITKVHLHPQCRLVEFWGKFTQERTTEYEYLAKDIQSPGNAFQELEGEPGDQCLVQVDSTWYRSRIVSRHGSKYSVFLIDKGRTYNTTTRNLAWGKKTHFLLPPEVEYCVLVNVLPVSTENRWSPMALEFLRTLAGKSVKAHVQDVLVAHRTFLLHIPCISTQMYEMGFAKRLPPDMFRHFVLKSLQSGNRADGSSDAVPFSAGGRGDGLHKQEFFLYPELPPGTVETVTVTEVTNPQRIFCQLKVFSKELKKLSDQLTQSCEGRVFNCMVGPEMIGFPCAARGSDGRWHRSVLQQVFPASKVVEVLNVDCGTKHFVQVENIRPLGPEFFRMPVVTYICSLYGIIDKGVGWTSSQVEYLRSLLLHKTVIAKFEYQSVSEGVHYVTLHGDENANLNNLFGSKESCLLECEKTLEDYAIRSPPYSCQPSTQPDKNQTKTSTPRKTAGEMEQKGKVEKLLCEDLSLNSSHMAVVQHVSDPSEFWIQTQNYSNQLDKLADTIYHLYKESGNKDVRNVSVGLYCAARAEDGDFYRATVADVDETKVEVFFVDYGNTEVVDRSDIRTLPVELRKLPCLALKCTLAGVKPKDGRWSQGASDFFLSVVADKTLNVHVTAKYDGGYIVQLTDPKADGITDVGTLLCTYGFAERDETQRPSKAKMDMKPAVLVPTQLPDARLSGVNWNNGMLFQTQNTVGPVSAERRSPTFKEHMFPIGSVLDVNVSYIESPNDFWCQLVHSAGHLKLLMHHIQARYENSEFQPVIETACVARHPNGMWYRALVIQTHKTPHVDVLFVDYGQTETVSLYDLRKIFPEFLTLHGQAFRCSLLNPVDPTSATNEWSEEAAARFHSFVETAASNFVILKCTIYAVMYSEQKIVFNVVDLETPFESVSTSLVNLVKSVPAKMATGLSFRLDTYYYSTHNIKTGTEEQVTVTCVNGVDQFYCQLERNADIIEDLQLRVRNLCQQLEDVKVPAVFGTLCFAKYTDGQWYRGQIKATKPTIEVHFVDYGDTIQVEKSHLLPIPKEAHSIMSVPVQAVTCSLSDVPANVPSEVNSWFEKSATECKFRALVVAREPDGKLQVELYRGKTQINSELKKKFQIEMNTQAQVVQQSLRSPEVSANHFQKPLRSVSKPAVEVKDHNQATEKNFSDPKSMRHRRDIEVPQQSALKSSRHFENGQKIKPATLELYKPPRQRQPCESTASEIAKVSESAKSKTRQETPLPGNEKHVSNSPDTEPQEAANVEKLSKLTDLPSKAITSGMEADVFVSHCINPLSFYVQLVKEEDELFSLVENLNDPQSIPQTVEVKDVHPGDLVRAEFADDSSWYRAVVRDVHGNMTVLVEFIDFGNTATMPVSKIGRLSEGFLQLPTFSTHCMLSEKEKALDPEVISTFKDTVGNGEKVFKCQFIRQLGSTWEVILKDSSGNVVGEVATKCSSDGSEVCSKKLENISERLSQNSDISHVPECSQQTYHQPEFLEGQKLEVYVTTTTDDIQTFWCQPADSEELVTVTSRISEVGNAVDHTPVEPGCLTPGSPCVALFSEDHLWYRAEVTDGDEEELSVVFVDYGNVSQVSVTDVRKMPADLMETPPVAFLCELDGFDASHGSWDSGAADEFSVLTADKVLQLTVTRITKDLGKNKCFVQMECEGQIINEVLKTWWKSSVSDSTIQAEASNTSKETELQCSSPVKDIAPHEEQVAFPESQETDHAIGHVCPESDPSEEQSSDKLDHETENKITKLGSNASSEDGLQPESFVEPSVEENQCLTDYMSLRHETTESETVHSESAVSTAVVCEILSPCGSDKGDSMLTGLDIRDEQDGEVELEKEHAAAVEPVELQTLETECDEESGITTTDLDSHPAEVDTCITETSCDDVKTSDPNGQGVDSELPTPTDIPLGRKTTIKMVLCKAVVPTTDEASVEESQILTQCNTTPGHEATESETVRSESAVSTAVICEILLPCGSDSGDSLLTGLDIRSEDGEVEIEKEHAAAVEPVELQTMESQCDEESGITTTDLDSHPAEVDTCIIETSCDDVKTSDRKRQGVDSELPTPTDIPLSSKTTIKMVPCKAVIPATDEASSQISKDLKQTQPEVALTPCELPAFEKVTEAGYCVSEQEVPCVTKTVKNDMMAEEETSPRHQEEAYSAALLVDCDSEGREPHTCTASPQNLVDEQLTTEDTCLANLSKEPSDDSPRGLSSQATEETVPHQLQLPCERLPDDQLTTLPPPDAEPQVCTVSCPDLSYLVEEVTCLVGEICLTDHCRDVPEAEEEDTEQLPHTPTKQDEDSSDEVLEEELSCASDSFEAQLSQITNLSLIISEGSADARRAEEQPEE
ncbi:uncharacterized protein V6R79_021669 [Siganus canaliculatus]